MSGVLKIRGDPASSLTVKTIGTTPPLTTTITTRADDLNFINLCLRYSDLNTMEVLILTSTYSSKLILSWSCIQWPAVGAFLGIQGGSASTRFERLVKRAKTVDEKAVKSRAKRATVAVKGEDGGAPPVPKKRAATPKAKATTKKEEVVGADEESKEDVGEPKAAKRTTKMPTAPKTTKKPTTPKTTTATTTAKKVAKPRAKPATKKSSIVINDDPMDVEQPSGPSGPSRQRQQIRDQQIHIDSDDLDEEDEEEEKELSESDLPPLPIDRNPADAFGPMPHHQGF